MFLILLALSIAATAALTVFAARPRLGTLVGIAALVATAVMALARGVGSAEPWEQRWVWVEELGLVISLRLDAFAVVMVLLVAVLGALVLWYSSGYFEPDRTTARFVGLFVAFAGAMTGLVLSADLFSMFIFWELTSICSFLLIGLNDLSSNARASALRALLVTSAGGLCLLAGVALFQVFVGTSSFAELAELAPVGTGVTVAAVLVLVGGLTKSAQFPFHFWLPGAMAAPTPVSAYLHSATMVKAGIVLMARMAPIFGDSATWRWIVVVAGGITMLLGGAQALRQIDAKLLLAHSTVSQLGFLTILVGLGVPGATYAGVAHLVAHAVFKAGLFLSVGAVDHATGTRDISTLSGVGKQLPALAVVTTLLAASMAGLIPLFGFATKEKALVALLDADDTVGAVGVVALFAVIIGAVLSAAYSVRLIRGLFGSKEGVVDTTIEHGPGLTLFVPVAAAAAASLVAGLAAGVVGGWLEAPAMSLDPSSYGYLKLWPGVNTALIISLVVLTVGGVIGWRLPIGSVRRASRISGERAFQFLLDGLISGSKRVTAVSQSGSLLVYLAVVMAVVVAALIAALVGAFGSDGAGIGLSETVLADSVLQAGVALLTVVFAVGVAVASHRFVAALLMGGVGFSCAVIFAMFGAPDLALTQILVETLTIVVFLLVLRQMPRRFLRPSAWAPRWGKVVLSLSVGVTVALFAVMVSAARTAPSAGEVYIEQSLPEAGGKNVVNVILVDFRGVDTMGEITVLAVAALGVANLVRMARRRNRERGIAEGAS